ncbi:copper resistance protein CopC [Acidocella sp.]|uniref:copper resistance protein CopC n=1 Tax=Acidocella sp. TaxID=50710 RepID=UPI00262BEE6C|nr:copper resistance protein CopC [Acidocella sp.]
MKLRIIALGLAFLAGAHPAFAHAHLLRSQPAAGSTVHAPKALRLAFTEALDLAFCRVTVTDAAGDNDATGSPQAVVGHPNEMAVALHIRKPGKLTVTWQALSTDTHKTHGSFSFTAD